MLRALVREAAEEGRVYIPPLNIRLMVVWRTFCPLLCCIHFDLMECPDYPSLEEFFDGEFMDPRDEDSDDSNSDDSDSDDSDSDDSNSAHSEDDGDSDGRRGPHNSSDTPSDSDFTVSDTAPDGSRTALIAAADRKSVV